MIGLVLTVKLLVRFSKDMSARATFDHMTLEKMRLKPSYFYHQFMRTVAEI